MFKKQDLRPILPRLEHNYIICRGPMLYPNISERRLSIASDQYLGYPLLIEWDGKVMLLRDTIYQALRHAILTGALPPGQMLGAQALAEQYTVSAARRSGNSCCDWNRNTW